MLSCYSYIGYYRAEEIPEEEVDVNQGSEVIVPVAHFHKEPRSTFGIPFLVKVNILVLRRCLVRFVQCY